MAWATDRITRPAGVHSAAICGQSKSQSAGHLFTSPLPRMDDATRYVLIAGLVLVLWFALSIAGGYIVHKTAQHRKRLFRGHMSENEE